MPDEALTPSDPEAAASQRLVLGELLGRGALTDVHRGHDRLLDRPVAVKMFHPHADEAARLRFEAEACALARLSHPGLVSIFNVGSLADRPYLVMQLVDGQSLATRLLSGPLGVADTVRTAAVLADGLAHAHQRGVVHRDVKPSNILLDTDGNPHLTDFGIALLAGADRLTRTDEIIGTPAYLAPEQVLGASIGPPADVYALGLVTLECLSGELEYAGPSRLEAALARLHRPPRIPAGLPRELAALLTAATAQNPADRPTAADCARTLQALAETAPVPLPAEFCALPAADAPADPGPVEPSLADQLLAGPSRAPAARSAVRTATVDPVRPRRSRRPLAVAGLAAAAAVTGAVLLLNLPQSGGTATTSGPASVARPATSGSATGTTPGAGAPVQAAAGSSDGSVPLVVDDSGGTARTGGAGAAAGAAAANPAPETTTPSPAARPTTSTPTTQQPTTTTDAPTTTSTPPTSSDTPTPADPTQSG